MAKFKGSLWVLTIVDVDGVAEGTVVGCPSSISLTLEAGEIDVSCLGNEEYADFLRGQKSWSLDLSAFVDFDSASIGLQDFFTYWDDGSTLGIQLQKAAATGAKGYTIAGDVIVSNVSLTGIEVNGGSAYDISMSGRGGLTFTELAAL